MDTWFLRRVSKGFSSREIFAMQSLKYFLDFQTVSMKDSSPKPPPEKKIGSVKTLDFGQ